MSYVEVLVATSASNAEQDGETLSHLGAVSISFELDPSTPLWEPDPEEIDLSHTKAIKALFPETQAGVIPTQLHEHNLSLLSITPLADQDWTRAWIQHFKAIALAPNFWVIPSWQEVPEEARDAIQLKLDPGLAFGTGAHPTTRLCIEWLATQSLADKTVLDFGCGSGILAISACLLGAQTVIAVDHDPQALFATAENAKGNHINERQLSITHSNALPVITADVLIANILATPLITLAQRLISYLKPKGLLVLSGILPEQVAIVMDAYAPFIKFEPAVEQEGWVRLEGVKQ